MLLRTQTVAYVVLAPKKAPGKYAKPANKSALISVNQRLINFPKNFPPKIHVKKTKKVLVF